MLKILTWSVSPEATELSLQSCCLSHEARLSVTQRSAEQEATPLGRGHVPLAHCCVSSAECAVSVAQEIPVCSEGILPECGREAGLLPLLVRPSRARWRAQQMAHRCETGCRLLCNVPGRAWWVGDVRLES